MMGHPTGRLLTDAVLTRVATAGEACGDGEAPADASILLAGGQPYAVVHHLPAAVMDGPLNDVNADAWEVYQVTAVGVDRVQAEWLRDRIRDVMLASRLSVTDRTVMGPSFLEPQVVLRDDAVQPPVWMAVDRYLIPTTVPTGD